MSHTVKIATQLKNTKSIQKACARLEWDCQLNSSAVLYDGKSVSGTVVRVPDWRYPAIVQESGEIATDTFGSRWGKLSDLDQLKKYYAVEETKSTLAAQGIYAREYTNEVDQSVTLVAEVQN